MSLDSTHEIADSIMSQHYGNQTADWPQGLALSIEIALDAERKVRQDLLKAAESADWALQILEGTEAHIDIRAYRRKLQDAIAKARGE